VSLVTVGFRVMRKWMSWLVRDQAVHSCPPEPAVSVSPCVVGRLQVKEQLERHSKHCAATPGMRQSKLFIGKHSDKLSVPTGLGQETMQVSNEVVNWPLYTETALTITGLLESNKCKKCGQEEESSYHILCQCPVMAGHKLDIFSSAWLVLTDVRRTSIRTILIQQCGQGSLKGPNKIRNAQWTQQ
jgi:hypothetical protein